LKHAENAGDDQGFVDYGFDRVEMLPYIQQSWASADGSRSLFSDSPPYHAWVRIKEHEVGPSGSPERLAAEFVMRRSPSAEPTRGAINYHATGEVEEFDGDPDACDVPLPTGICLRPESEELLWRKGDLQSAPEQGAFEVLREGDSGLRFRFPNHTGAEFQVVLSWVNGAPREGSFVVPDELNAHGFTVSGLPHCRAGVGGQVDVLALDLGSEDEDAGSPNATLALDFSLNCGGPPNLHGRYRYEP
jgi:hypothetical protein